MSAAVVEVASLLIDIEAALRRLGLWEDQAPPAAALNSSQPFCFDTLEFSQWLQFILLPRFATLIDSGAPLPDKCGVAPMAEVWFADTPYEGSQVIELLQQLDALVEEIAAADQQ